MKKSQLPNVSSSKVCDLKLWYFAEIQCTLKIEELVDLNSQISFCDVTTDYNPNCLFGHESTNPKNEELETISYDKYKSESLNSLSYIV